MNAGDIEQYLFCDKGKWNASELPYMQNIAFDEVISITFFKGYKISEYPGDINISVAFSKINRCVFSFFLSVIKYMLKHLFLSSW